MAQYGFVVSAVKNRLSGSKATYSARIRHLDVIVAMTYSRISVSLEYLSRRQLHWWSCSANIHKFRGGYGIIFPGDVPRKCP